VALGTAVVVGVGPGLGVALARAFAGAGHPVAVLDIDKARLDTAAAELASAGQHVRGYVADAADSGSLRAALRSAITELGSPDVLVYHVGAVRKDSAIGGDDQDWATGMAVRVLGARVAADAVLPNLREGRGSLLFTGGGFALHPSKEYASLSVGKAVRVRTSRPASGNARARDHRHDHQGDRQRTALRRGSTRPGLPRPAPPARGGMAA
jgi:NAD(P)-dependent dehydrogenase (short-subunit alcohol dehydrogenase family)